ncbi:MAG TPA: ferredoxin [Pseudonocardiaceae bacterium]
MRVTVDDKLCMGHTLCSVNGPDVYDLDETGHCRPLVTEVPAELEEQAVYGADACPERAITVAR